jgi:hypothetical protein
VLAADAAEAPRLFLMVGNTLGGFDPLDQMRHLGECVHKGDILIVDANLHGGAPIKPSEEQRRFAFAPLASTGLAAEDGDLEFVEKSDDRLEGLFMLTRRFIAQRDLRVFAAGRPIPIPRGERILLNFRYLFSAEAFRWLIQEHAGLRIVGEIESEDGRFLTAVCIKA